MKIGSIIRKHRKIMDMTQEEMANRLGVTTPAVNKWENNNTLPDITLLAPIARLLNITTDELLSFRDELTTEEINHFISKIQKNLDEKDYDEVFVSARKKIEEYPNCETLIWQTAVVLNARLTVIDLSDKEKYEDAILGWYEQCLQSENDQIRRMAADSLFNIYFQKKNYEKALKYTVYFSQDNPESKRMKALIYSKTGRKEDAYRLFEELVFSEYQHMQIVLNDLRILYMEDNNYKMVNKLVDLSSSIASVFEMGRYSEVSIGLDAAVWKKDASRTAEIIQELLESINTICDFTKSSLYQHMNFKETGTELSDSFRKELLKSLKDEPLDYMEGNGFWENLKNEF